MSFKGKKQLIFLENFELYLYVLIKNDYLAMLRPEDAEYMNCECSKKYTSKLFMKGHEQCKIHKGQTFYCFSSGSKNNFCSLHNQRLQMYLDRARHSREEYWVNNRRREQIFQSFFFAEENERRKFLEQEAALHQISFDEIDDDDYTFIHQMEALEDEQINYFIDEYVKDTSEEHR